MELVVVRGDLLDQEVDVIVNAWNRNLFPWWLLLPQGVSRAIKRRAGTRPFDELFRHGPMPLWGRRPGPVMTACPKGTRPFDELFRHGPMPLG
ncbi:MAG: hypothetical protein AAFU79_10180, partial [Myxococcota bacterium]